MTTVYLLYYDHDNGDREEWNTFYTPVEVFTTKKARKDRKKELKDIDPALEFYETENVLDATEDYTIHDDW